MSYVINKLKECELIELTDNQVIILTHLVSYIQRFNLEEDYLPSDLYPVKVDYQNITFSTPPKTVEEKFPDELSLLNKVLALYAMSDKGV